ncbi:hypothetical protein AC579_3742 [Pseudocercospora musae]|uniref:J domain-containing protein n=1 Tax=Pseudocercospora musae TaxID=113226 RepID=A0A139HIS9_9PEZI|nr:hypothetical protein AC579_3742 [Pseudocercospora musae]
MDEPEQQDHYAILSISVDATTKEIKSRARKLYLLHHLDKGGNPEQFCKLRKSLEMTKIDPYLMENTLTYGNPGERTIGVEKRARGKTRRFFEESMKKLNSVHKKLYGGLSRRKSAQYTNDCVRYKRKKNGRKQSEKNV